MAEYVSETIGSADTWTDAILPLNGNLALTITIPDASTVTLQSSTDGGANWEDVDTYTASIRESVSDTTPGVLYRGGVASGDYDSGDVVVKLSRRANI